MEKSGNFVSPEKWEPCNLIKAVVPGAHGGTDEFTWRTTGENRWDPMLIKTQPLEGIVAH